MLVGDPSNPNGGLLERFNFPDDSNPTLPALGLTFSGATPDTEYPTTIYTAEYDGLADFPKYPLNLLADLNAVLGAIYVHLDYPNLTDAALASAVEVPTSEGYDGDTTYYMIPTDDLPLLEPLRTVPVIGPLVADLIEPDLEVLVNLGYGDPEYGWVNENADVPTPFGIIPDFEDLAKVPGMLIEGAFEGIENVINDLTHPAELFSLDDNPLTELLNNPVPFEVMEQSFPIDDDQTIPEAISSAASRIYSSFLATADIANTLFTTLPAYTTEIFINELADGDLLGAIGNPLAITVGLLPVAGLLEFLTLGETVMFSALDLASPFIDVSDLLP